MAKHLAWSYSRYHTYEECPKQLYHTAVAPRGHPDRVDYVESEPQRAGKEIDAALCSRISDGTPLPAKFAPYEPMAQLVLDQPGQKFTQMQLALDQAFQPCGTREWDRVWVRVIYDLAIINNNHAHIWDWKNGQISLDDKQLKLFAVTGFHQFAGVETIDTKYIWLKHGTTSDATYHRRELPDLWGEFMPTVERMQASFVSNHWPATPQKGQWGWNCKRCLVNAAGKCAQAAVKPG